MLNDDTDNGKNEQHHGCVMYQEYIPHKIWYNGGSCPYYEKKE